MSRKAKILKPGDKVAIVALSSHFSKKDFLKGIQGIKKLGLEPVFDKGLYKKDFIFAGSLEHRFQQLKKALLNKNIKAIWCVRGGYGAYDLPELLLPLKKKLKSKILLGYSDVTALHILFNNWGWPTLHGPLVTRLGRASHKGLEKKVLEETLFNPRYCLRVKSGLKSLSKRSVASAPVVGGNLSLIVSSLGTSWEINTDGKILFIEDIYEPGRKIDRLLSQLKQAGKFKNLKGLVIGDFTYCQESDGKILWPEVFKRHFSKSRFPVIQGLKAGHGRVNLVFPLGVKVRVSTKATPTFEVVEAYHG